MIRPYTLPLKPLNDALTKHRSPGPIPGERVQVEALSSTKEKAVKSRSQRKSGTVLQSTQLLGINSCFLWSNEWWVSPCGISSRDLNMAAGKSFLDRVRFWRRVHISPRLMDRQPDLTSTYDFLTLRRSTSNTHSVSITAFGFWLFSWTSNMQCDLSYEAGQSHSCPPVMRPWGWTSDTQTTLFRTHTAVLFLTFSTVVNKLRETFHTLL